MGRFFVIVAALWLAAMPAPAKEVAVDLELVLAVDISGSIDEGKPACSAKASSMRSCIRT